MRPSQRMPNLAQMRVGVSGLSADSYADSPPHPDCTGRCFAWVVAIRPLPAGGGEVVSYRVPFSGNFELSFSRSSTIEERTCATLWCGIRTLLTISDRLFKSRSTAFNT